MSIPTPSRFAAAAWIGIPFVLYLAMLRLFWFNSPAWDDFDAVLDTVLRLRDASSAREWLGVLVSQHNEHRIAFSRLVAWAFAAAPGGIDFRFLVLAANAAWIGILALMWAELRHALSPALLGGAAFLVLNLAYYEAALVSMAGSSSFWAVLFAFACLFFAMRDGRANAALGLVFGALAIATQASGLLALPLAAVFCALRGRRAHALLYGLAALALWAVYFIGYARPPHHPALLHALAHPLDAVGYFLVVTGSLFPSVGISIALAVVLLLVLAWALRQGLWRRSPTTCAWIAFILASAAAITVGRAGFGLAHSSRYAIYASILLVLVLLAAATVTAPWKPRANVAFAIGCVLVSALVSWASLWWATAYSFAARLIAKAQPQALQVVTDPYFGVVHSSPPRAHALLDAAARRGLWHAREEPIHPTTVRFLEQVPGSMQRAGRVDHIGHAGKRVTVFGWSHLPATRPGRMISVSGDAMPVRTEIKIASRIDVAMITRVPALVFSGFELGLEYASEDEAKRAASSLCVLAEDAQRDARMLGDAPGCPKEGA